MAIPAHMPETKVLDPSLERTTVGVGVVDSMGTLGVEGVAQAVVSVEMGVARGLVHVVAGVVVVPATRHTLTVELTVTVLKATCGTVTV